MKPKRTKIKSAPDSKAARPSLAERDRQAGAELRRRFAEYVRRNLVAVFVPFEPYGIIEHDGSTTEHDRPEQVHIEEMTVDLAGGGMVVFTDAVRAGLSPDGLRLVLPGDGAYWFDNILRYGTDAVREAAARLVESEDLDSLGTNTLSAIGNLVSIAMRRSLLLAELEKNDWNLTRTSEVFRLGSSGNVLRLIRDLGLSDAYAEARQRGKAPKGRPAKHP